jgi:hypothetical protein
MPTMRRDPVAAALPLITHDARSSGRPYPHRPGRSFGRYKCRPAEDIALEVFATNAVAPQHAKSGVALASRLSWETD